MAVVGVDPPYGLGAARPAGAGQQGQAGDDHRGKGPADHRDAPLAVLGDLPPRYEEAGQRRPWRWSRDGKLFGPPVHGGVRLAVVHGRRSGPGGGGRRHPRVAACGRPWPAQGYRASWVQTGAEALELAREPHDLVLLDLDLAGHRRCRGLPAAPGRAAAAGHRHADRPPGRDRRDRRAGRRRRRLPDQAVPAGRAAGPDPRPHPPPGVGRPRRAAGRRATWSWTGPPAGRGWPAASSTCVPRSSTCSPC